MKAPKDCKTIVEICKLQTDNHSLKEHWIITDGYTVSLANQRSGEPATEIISMPKAKFDKLIEWYFKPQKERK